MRPAAGLLSWLPASQMILTSLPSLGLEPARWQRRTSCGWQQLPAEPSIHITNADNISSQKIVTKMLK